jgi:hypothetical protein
LTLFRESCIIIEIILIFYITLLEVYFIMFNLYKKSLAVFSLLIISLVFVGCSNNENSELQIFSSSNPNMYFSYPSTWTLEELNQGDFVVANLYDAYNRNFISFSAISNDIPEILQMLDETMTMQKLSAEIDPSISITNDNIKMINDIPFNGIETKTIQGDFEAYLGLYYYLNVDTNVLYVAMFGGENFNIEYIESDDNIILDRNIIPLTQEEHEQNTIAKQQLLEILQTFDIS